MATKKTAKAMSKEELKEKLTVEKATKTSAKKPVEKALKVTKKATKKAEPQVEKPEAEEAKVEKPKKQIAKTTAKKPATKKVESPLDKFFPASVEVEGIAFTRHEEVASWEDFKAFTEASQNAGNHVVLACNWPKKFKKAYDDNSQGDKLFPKDGFEHDLDFNEIIMLQQTREAAITVSLLTEQVVIFKDADFSMTDFGYFLANGMPFVVYTYNAE